MTKYDEDYLNGLIAKAKKSWEGVDVDSFMSDLRDDLSDKEVAENEQQAIEDFRKAMEEGYEQDRLFTLPTLH